MVDKPKKVLIVEDDEDIGAALQAIVDSIEGMQATLCARGDDAIQTLRKMPYDLVLCDLVLPGSDGVKVVEMMKRGRANRNTPVIVISGALNGSTKRRLAEYGVRYMLEKPFNADQIAVKLQAVLVSHEHPLFYDPRLVAAFRSAVSSFLEDYVDERVKLEGERLRTERTVIADVVTIVGFAGEKAHGLLGLLFPKSFLDYLAPYFFPDSDKVWTQQNLIDIAAESANQVCGKLKSELGFLGVVVKIALPEIIVGRQPTIRYRTSNPILNLQARVKERAFFAEFCLEQESEDIINIEDAAAPAVVEGGLF